MGDIHDRLGNMMEGIYELLRMSDSRSSISAIVQVGDLSFTKNMLDLVSDEKFPVPIYAIEGNHDEEEVVSKWSSVTEVAENLFFVPRGTVLTLDGRTVGFLGGATSTDALIRKKPVSSFECVTPEQVSLFDSVHSLDLLVTHSPPRVLVTVGVNPMDLRRFNREPGWVDPSAVLVEELWKRLKYPPLICGHLHKPLRWGTARSLGAFEVDLF